MVPFEIPASPLLLLACLLVTSLFAVLFFPQRASNLPPGPPADPIIGHARIIPIDYQWKTFASWRKKYGLCIPTYRTAFC